MKEFLQAVMKGISKFWNWFIAPIDKLWDKFKDYFGSVVKPCRFSVLMLLAVLLFFWFAPQGQDVLRSLGESGKIKEIIIIVIFYCALAWYAGNTWYWGRTMLRIDFDYSPDHGDANKEQRLGTRKQLPRILGFLAFVFCAFSFFRASAAYSEEGLNSVMWVLIFLGILCLLLGLVFYVLAEKRTDISNRLYGKLKDRRFAQQAAAKKIVDGLAMETTDRAYDVRYKSFKELPPLTLTMLGLALGISVVLFLLFLFLQGVAAWLGTATIVLLAAASWVAAGSVLVYWGTQKSFPILTVLLLLAIIFSLWNDNHLVHTWSNDNGQQAVMPEKSPAAGAYDFNNWMDQRQNLTVEKDFNNWLVKEGRLTRWDKTKGGNHQPHPVFIVAAEGGGIRAAYWTAVVLAELQERNHEFAEHVYAMSGVSGGSLGIAVFAAMAAQDTAPDKFRDFAKDILGHDFLAPTVAYLLYPDLLQRIIPWPVYSFDRGRAMERSWEGAWKKQMKNDNFGKPFHSLYWGKGFQIGPKSPAMPGSVPRLFLNSTWVETGKRVIASNLKIDNATFHDAVDFFDVIGAAVPLSSAVHNSARFTYISPAGTVLQPDGKTWGHLVDGGYFENSGATTAHEILMKMRSGVQEEEWNRIIPVVIMIINDPGVPAKDECGEKNAAEDDTCKARNFLNELLSPPIALMNTRGARGSFARDVLKSWVADEKGKKDTSYNQYWQFSLKQEKGKNKKKPLPLGWVLSEAAKENMEAQLKNILDGELGVKDPLDLPQIPQK